MHLLLSRIAILLAAAFLAGCASTQRTESLLTAAGFQQVPATSPQLSGSVQELPPGRITLAPRGGTNFYLFPASGRQSESSLLYVGGEAQYEEYQRLLKQQEAADAAAGHARLMSSPNWTGWGAWDGPLITIPTPTSR